MTITKTDFSTGELIPNCGIEILDESKNVLVQGRTDDKGEVTFKRLPMGNYYYREFDAPKGYYLDTTPYAFTIGEDGIVKAKMTNKLQEVILNIYKTDGETKKALAGAEFKVFDKNGNELGKITTDENGQATTRDKIKLYAGIEYKVKETKAPENYVLDEKTYTFEFTEDGQVFTTTQKNEYGGGVTVSQTPETPNRQVTTQDTPIANTGTSRNAAPFALAMTLCVATAIAASASKKKKQTK